MSLHHLPTLARHPERLPLRVDLRMRTRDGFVCFKRVNEVLPATLMDVRIVARRDPARGLQRWLVWDYQLDDPSRVMTPGEVTPEGYMQARMLVSDCRRYFFATLDDVRVKPARDHTSTSSS